MLFKKHIWGSQCPPDSICLWAVMLVVSAGCSLFSEIPTVCLSVQLYSWELRPVEHCSAIWLSYSMRNYFLLPLPFSHTFILLWWSVLQCLLHPALAMAGVSLHLKWTVNLWDVHSRYTANNWIMQSGPQNCFANNTFFFCWLDWLINGCSKMEFFFSSGLKPDLGTLLASSYANMLFLTPNPLRSIVLCPILLNFPLKQDVWVRYVEVIVLFLW